MALSYQDAGAGIVASPNTLAPLAGVSILGNLGIGGAGKTAHQQAPVGFNQSSNDRANEIIKKLQGFAGAGTFNEGQLSEGISAVKSLQEEMKAGTLSQSDYVNITNQFLPTLISYGNQMAGSGSAGAKAVVPWLTQLNDLQKDTQIYQAGQQYLGRDITPAELAEFKPRFADNPDVGNAYIAEFAKQEAQSPQALAKKAGAYSGDVNGIFQDLLQRGASKDELDYFGRALASGQTTAYQLKQYVQTLPEYTNQQDTQFRQGLNQELQNYDVSEFGREKNAVQSDYAQRGLEMSPSLDYALTDLMGKIASNRSAYLANLSASQYGGNKEAALGAYQQSQNQYLGNLDYQRNQNQQNLNYYTQRADQGADYQRQMSDYMNYLNASKGNKGYNPLYGAIGGTVGAIGGGLADVPGGAGAGYQIGSGLGNAYSYLNS